MLFRNSLLNKVMKIKHKGQIFQDQQTSVCFGLIRSSEAGPEFDFSQMDDIHETFNKLENRIGVNKVDPLLIETLIDSHSSTNILVLPDHLISSSLHPYCISTSHSSFKAGHVFPDESKADSYKDYYLKKYEVNIEECETMVPIKYLKLKLNVINWKPYPIKNDNECKIHFPESLCLAYPISYRLWREIGLIPGVLYRINQDVHTHDFLHLMQVSCNPKDEHLTADKPNCETLASSDLQCKLRKALILPSAMEDVNNELLEFFGDSFLKYATSVQLFFQYPTTHENTLSTLKVQVVNNKKLQEIGLARQIWKYLHHERFDAANTKSYLKVDETEISDTLNQNARNKMVADAVEAIIGAFYVTSSEEFVLNVLEWFTIDMSSLKKFKTCPRYEYNDFTNDMTDTDINKMTKLLTKDIKQLESLLNYKFRNPLLYVEACSHNSYPKWLNRLTFANERLEFIGDAILEILITKELIRRNDDERYDHGNLSNMRTGIVNTYLFAVLAVSLDLHKHLKFCSPKLMDLISKWICKVEKLEKEEALHKKVCVSFGYSVARNC